MAWHHLRWLTDSQQGVHQKFETVGFIFLLLSTLCLAISNSSPRDEIYGEIPESIRKNPNESEEKGYIKKSHDMKNASKYSEQKVTLYCDVVGMPAPSYKWTKNGILLQPQDHNLDRRITIKDTLYGNVLKIENLQPSDSGHYACTGSNPYGSHTVAAFLTVSPEVNNRRRNKKRPKSDNPDGSNFNGNRNPDNSGFCQPFKSVVCKSFIGNEFVYVTNNLHQHMTELTLTKLWTKMSEVVDEQCLQPLAESICFKNFPLCSQRTTVAIPRKVCRNDCEQLTQYNCKKDFEKLRMSLKYLYQYSKTESEINFVSVLPQCSTLAPSNSKEAQDCIPLKHVQRLHQPTINNDNKEKWQWTPSGGIKDQNARPNKPSTNFEHNPETVRCYNQTGASYIGYVSTTLTQKTCRSWKLSKYSYLGDENYCRNPTPNARKSPWCFVDPDGTKEDCNVPSCHDFMSNEQQMLMSVRNMMPIFISLGLLAFMAVAVLVVCCMCRRATPSTANGYQGIKQPNQMNQYIPPSSHAPVIQHLQQTELQYQPQMMDVNEYPINKIRFGDEIGMSPMGQLVRKGELIGLYSETSLTPVMIKVLSTSACVKSQADFRRDVNTLSKLNHPNIQSLLGVVMNNTTWCMVFELHNSYDLHELITSCNPAPPSQSSPISRPETEYECEPLSKAQILYIAMQIANGVEYLASRCFVHKDLATRNILVGEYYQCKISDIGSSRQIYDGDYYCINENNRLPIRWMSPEAILRGSFTEASDVWSFGVLLWELWSSGWQPYYGYSDSSVIELVRGRQLLERPDDCPPKVYNLILDCWQDKASLRPTFNQLHLRLKNIRDEILNELSTPSQGSGQTNSTGMTYTLPYMESSTCRPPSQRIIGVPIPCSPVTQPVTGSPSSYSSHSSSSTSTSRRGPTFSYNHTHHV